MNSTLRALLSNTLKVLVTLVMVFFVVRKLAENWPEIAGFGWQVDPLLLAGSMALQLAMFFLFARVWVTLIKGFGHDVSLSSAFKISYLSNLGRYLPGKIWQLVGMLYLCKRAELPQTVALASWGIAVLFALASSFLVGVLAFLFDPQIRSVAVAGIDQLWLYLLAAVSVGSSLMVVLFPIKVLSWYNWGLRKLGREPITLSLSARTATLVYGGYFLTWVGYGCAFWLFVRSVTGLATLPWLWGIAAYVIPYQAGYFAFFSPGGIGVRELVMTAMLTPFFGPIAAGVAVAARFWNLTVEIIASIVAWGIRMK